MSLSTKRINGLILGVAFATLFAGCGGRGAGGGASALPQLRTPGVSAQSVKPAKGNVSFTVAITPRAKAARIAPKYISASTQSLRILTDGTNPVAVNLTPSSSNCSPMPAAPASYICQAGLSATAGNHIFTVTTYDSTEAKGNVLSTNATAAVYVKPTGTTTVSIVLDGVVRYVVLSLAMSDPPSGKAVQIGLTAVVEDADKNLIFGAALYEHPVTLTTSDRVNGPLSKTVLNSPADTAGIMTNYTGGNVPAITFSATAPGLLASGVTNAVLAPNTTRATVLYRFTGTASGTHPGAALLTDRAGNLYGTTSSGGSANAGTFFKLTRTGSGYTQSVLHNFGSGSDGANPIGNHPIGNLVTDSSGGIYGATDSTVFKLTPTGTGYSESTIYAFDKYEACGPGPACFPGGGLALDSSGALYGSSRLGGLGEGTIYKLTPAGSAYSESDVVSFDVRSVNGFPTSDLIESGGIFYGTTSFKDDGGCSQLGGGGGAVFSLSPSSGYSGYSLLSVFGNYDIYGNDRNLDGDGTSPNALIADGAGSLYGTTTCGGSKGFGTVFAVGSDPPKDGDGSGGIDSKLYNFQGGWDGANPAAGLVADSAGNLFGTTEFGGSGSGVGSGTVFKLTPTPSASSGYVESILHRFNGSVDGANPAASLIVDSSGALYGTTSNGGSGFGTVFKLTK
jgi:uncharacterized repeat protein (TIGR03803 family)